LKLVDAKFALPKERVSIERKSLDMGESVVEGGEADSLFVCLDDPEYPGEHDDVTITFDVESGMLC
jgi:hypothetical protein